MIAQMKRDIAFAHKINKDSKQNICRDITNRIILLLHHADNVAEQKVHQNDMATFYTIQHARASLFKLKANINENSIEYVSHILSEIQMTLMAAQTVVYSTRKVVIATPIKKIDLEAFSYENTCNEPSTPPAQFTTMPISQIPPITLTTQSEEIACQALLYL